MNFKTRSQTSIAAWLGILTALIPLAAADEDRDATDANPKVVRAVKHEGALLLDCRDVAKALDWELKIVQPDRLITFCRTQDTGVCIPILLSPENYRADKGPLVSADVLAKALRFHVTDTDGKVAIQPTFGKPPRDLAADVPAYNADWGAGRGFRTGQTLPDIPLTDMQGREVRFSQFLGKRYIIYCWASW